MLRRFIRWLLGGGLHRVATPSRPTPKVTLSAVVIRRDDDGNETGRENVEMGNVAVKRTAPRRHSWFLGLPLFLISAPLFYLWAAISAVVLTNAGEEWLVDKIGETVQTQPQYVDWGTGAGTAAKADVALFTAAAEARVLSTYSKVGSGSAALAQYVGTLTSASAQTITNVGFWTAVSGGTLVIHADHAGVALAINDQIQYTLTIDPS